MENITQRELITSSITSSISRTSAVVGEELQELRASLARQLTDAGGQPPIGWAEMNNLTALEERARLWRTVERVMIEQTGNALVALRFVREQVMRNLTEHGPARSTDAFTNAISLTQGEVQRNWLRRADAMIEAFEDKLA